MALLLFKFQEDFLIDLLLIQLTQLEKTGSINKVLIPLGNIKNHVFSRQFHVLFREQINFNSTQKYIYTLVHFKCTIKYECECTSVVIRAF